MQFMYSIGMADEPPQVDDPKLKELQAEEASFRDAMLDAVLSWGTRKARLAYYEGYVKGRDNTKDWFANFMRQVGEGTIKLDGSSAADSQSAAESKPLGLINRPPKDEAAPSTKKIVLDAMQAHPGLTGAELLRKIHANGVDLHERTFRTALFRLKVPAGAMPGPGHILAVNNGWYRFEDAPPEAIENVRRAREELIRMTNDPKENGGQQ